LPVWQSLYDELKGSGFMVVSVAQEARGCEHARPFIEQAKAGYWTLIDAEHRVSALYGMVNVPQAVWINEAGHIVRPAETAGSTDHFRRMDRKTRTHTPEALVARKAAQDAYLNAVRAWVREGANALDEASVTSRQPRISEEMAQAQAHFRLAHWLRGAGRDAEAARHFAEASRLYPESWSFWRQAADLEQIGGAVSEKYWARVDALGDRPYYPPPDVPGFKPA